MLCRSLPATFAVAVLVAMLTGCGAAPGPATVATTPITPTNPAVAAGPIDGRWSFIPVPVAVSSASAVASIQEVRFDGAIDNNAGIVTAAGFVSSTTGMASSMSSLACLPKHQAFLHGTFNAARHLSLVSDPVDGGILQIDADVGADPHVLSTGTVTLSGPCAASSSVSASLYEAMNGTFAGPVLMPDSVTRSFVAQGTATAAVTETAPDITGATVVSGVVAYVFPTCTVQYTFKENRYGGASYDSTTSPVSSNGATGQGGLPSLGVTGIETGASVTAFTAGLGLDCQPQAFGAALTTLQAVLTKQ